MHTVVFGDVHIPNQNNKAVKILFEHIKKNNPDRIIINGDLLDMWELSSFDRAPKGGKTFSEEIHLAQSFLGELSRLSEAQITYIEGNHSFRLRKYLLTQAPELYDLDVLDIDNLLGLDDLDIEYVAIPDECSKFQDNYVMDQNFYVGHFNAVRGASGATAKQLVDKYGVNIIQAHVHRGGVYYKRLITGEILTGIEGYCMCDLNPSYMRNCNWQAGWVDIVDEEPILHHIPC